MGKILRVLIQFTLFGVALTLSNDITLAVGISVVSTIVVCFLIAVFTWKCCLSSANAKKHQFEIGSDLTHNVINNYVYESTNRDVCSKCGQQCTPAVNDVVHNHVTENNSNHSVNQKNVEVVVHNNSRQKSSEEYQKSFIEEEIETPPPVTLHNNASFVVHLKKTGTGSLGLSIVGGRNSKLGDIGIFIKSAIENSPAFLCGQIKPWDQILKVNETVMEGRTIQEALTVLKSQPTDVFLTILPSEIATAKLEEKLRCSREPESPSYNESMLSQQYKVDLYATDTKDDVTDRMYKYSSDVTDRMYKYSSDVTEAPTQDKNLRFLHDKLSSHKDYTAPTEMEISTADTERYCSEDSMEEHVRVVAEEAPLIAGQVPLAAHQPPLAAHQPPLAAHQPPLAAHQPPLAAGPAPQAALEPPLAALPVSGQEASLVSGKGPLVSDGQSVVLCDDSALPTANGETCDVPDALGIDETDNITPSDEARSVVRRSSGETEVTSQIGCTDTVVTSQIGCTEEHQLHKNTNKSDNEVRVPQNNTELSASHDEENRQDNCQDTVVMSPIGCTDTVVTSQIGCTNTVVTSQIGCTDNSLEGNYDTREVAICVEYSPASDIAYKDIEITLAERLGSDVTDRMYKYSSDVTERLVDKMSIQKNNQSVL